jgi:hypothetical protein
MTPCGRSAGLFLGHARQALQLVFCGDAHLSALYRNADHREPEEDVQSLVTVQLSLPSSTDSRGQLAGARLRTKTRAAELCQHSLPPIHLSRTVDIEQNGTVWKSPVLPHSGYDNENDSGIPRRRAPKRLRRSAADGRRSRAHPTAEPWPSSHCKTAQSGIAVCG